MSPYYGQKGLKSLNYETSAGFVEKALTLLYKPALVKRILFRPFIGNYFPYIDIRSLHQTTQLSFLYGRITMAVSKERRCVVCKKELNKVEKTMIEKESFPIYMCKKCEKKVFYEYWNCLKSTMIRAYNSIPDKRIDAVNLRHTKKNELNNENSANSTIAHRCANFLEPRCGYPVESSNNNPCLKNHAIGILMGNQNSINIFSAPIKKLKYMMIWRGGVAGVILGFKKRIINLELVETLMKKLFKIVYQVVRNINQKFKRKAEAEQIKIFIPQIQKIKNKSQAESFIEWLFYTFLRYYQSYGFQKFCRLLLDKPLFILKEVLKGIFKKTELDLEVLEFLKLYEWYPPLDLGFRDTLEKKFQTILDLDKMLQFRCSESEEILKNREKFSAFLKKWYSFDEITFSALREDLEIYNILGLFGNRIIINSNVSNQPCSLSMKDLSGRYIY